MAMLTKLLLAFGVTAALAQNYTTDNTTVDPNATTVDPNATTVDPISTTTNNQGGNNTTTTTTTTTTMEVSTGGSGNTTPTTTTSTSTAASGNATTTTAAPTTTTIAAATTTTAGASSSNNGTTTTAAASQSVDVKVQKVTYSIELSVNASVTEADLNSDTKLTSLFTCGAYLAAFSSKTKADCVADITAGNAYSILSFGTRRELAASASRRLSTTKKIIADVTIKTTATISASLITEANLKTELGQLVQKAEFTPTAIAVDQAKIQSATMSGINVQADTVTVWNAGSWTVNFYTDSACSSATNMLTVLGDIGQCAKTSDSTIFFKVPSCGAGAANEVLLDVVAADTTKTCPTQKATFVEGMCYSIPGTAASLMPNQQSHFKYTCSKATAATSGAASHSGVLAVALVAVASFFIF